MMKRKGFAMLGVMTLSAALFTGIGSASSAEAAAGAEPAAGCRTDSHGLTLKTLPDTGDAHFQAIQFLSPSIGRAAGNGFMIGTSDGGCHWQSIQSSGKYSFNQIQFLTNSVGYALAQTDAAKPNLLLRTANGGSAFKTISTGGNAFNRIQFFSQQVGFGFTQAFTYKTTNAGQTWTKLSTPPNTRYAHFITPDKGWILVFHSGGGYDVKRTVDGGRTWSNKLYVHSEQTSGGMIYGTDSSDIWVVLLGGSGMSQTSYSLYHTADAGEHWKQLISNPTAGGGPAPGPKVDGLTGPFGAPQDMQAIGKKAAYLAASSGAVDQIGIGRSLDDGRTWKNVTGVPGYGGKLSFPAALSGYIATTSSLSGGIYSTVDGGIHWSKKFSIPEPVEK
ncbi:WD40/YVTN/BNR-like repeat-containing protein [Paenibacillus solisilvae]|uniref:WD40/YVTN/BNR-like repeat-containing protein n=1 Tax=Paenibacillus solisilvae TaxID=2486751 RepID=A0ABW0VPQ0_9BACL